ncbi:hypothetical protein ACERZ8_10350 [Tateyamaria armeniaca]|uniref:PH domain-containing protein n=1 Tax=Tateyamaria armeniaca TaxID=2518930 RepID=A0ABW8UTQ8_9RHOB
MTQRDEWTGLLDPGERIIWQGKPSTRVQMEFDSPFAVVFMMFWGGIPLFMVISEPRTLLLGVPGLFLGIALYFFVGQHFWAAFMRSRTFYSLSNTRAFIARATLGGRKLDSYPITEQTTLQLDEGRKRAIWFGTSHGRQMFSNKTENPVGFERLDNQREVYQLLRAVQRGEA